MTEEEIHFIYMYLKERFLYDESGFLKNKVNNEKWLGHPNRNGKKLIYEVSIRINKKKYHMTYAHAIYIFHHKIKPKYIDYVNDNTVDTRIENLKESNMSNRVMFHNKNKKNKTGYTGVIKEGNKFCARIMINKKFKRLGVFCEAKEAYQAYIKEKNKIKNL